MIIEKKVSFHLCNYRGLFSTKIQVIFIVFLKLSKQHFHRIRPEAGIPCLSAIILKLRPDTAYWRYTWDILSVVYLIFLFELLLLFFFLQNLVPYRFKRGWPIRNGYFSDKILLLFFLMHQEGCAVSGIICCMKGCGSGRIRAFFKGRIGIFTSKHFLLGWIRIRVSFKGRIRMLDKPSRNPGVCINMNICVDCVVIEI